MRQTEKVAPIAAALTALTTFLCCLPMGFAAAAAPASLSAVAASYYWWFIAASALLLGLGVFQLRQQRATCPTRGYSSWIVLGVSAAIVLMVVVFPQTLAGLMADWLP